MQAQDGTTGKIVGKLPHNKMESQSHPFVNVIIKETNKGTTSDFCYVSTIPLVTLS